MIRILIGSALPILGLGAAVALVGPDFVTGPRGEPLVVAAPGAASLHEARFDGLACPPIFDIAKPLPSEMAKQAAAGSIVTLSFRYGADGMSMTMEKGVSGADADAALLLVFDDTGRIVEVTYPPAMRDRMLADAYAAGCLEGAESEPAGI